MNEERKTWLDSLKEGDEVCIDTTMVGSENRQSIKKIKKITSTRKFRVDTDLFDQYGEHRQGWNHSILIPPTLEVRQGIRDRNKRYYVKNIDYSQVSQEKINMIYDILKTQENPK